MRLYSYYLSSASYRVRIALALKGLSFETVPVHLLKDGGMQHSEAFGATNPARLVPVLEDGGLTLTQSLAIMEYLDEAYPQAPLLPDDMTGRARVRALALAIACDIHPLDNLRVLQYLQGTLGITPDQKDSWYGHWIALGFASLDAQLASSAATGIFCHGDTPGLADCCLVPQVANSRRVQLPLEPYPTIRRIVQACEDLPAFQQAAPARQPDAT